MQNQNRIDSEGIADMSKKNIILIITISFVITITVVGIIIGSIYIKNIQTEKEPKPIPYVLDDMLINLKESQSILKCKIAIEVTDKELIRDFDEKKYIINHEINEIIRNKTEEEIEGSKGLILLQKEITNKLSEIFNSDKIINVYFEQLIVQ